MLKVEEPKAEAREAINSAVDSGNVDALKAAIAKAKAANLDAKEYKVAEEAIAKEAEKERLKGVLQGAVEKTKAINEKEIEELQAAKDELSETITAAKAEGVENLSEGRGAQAEKTAQHGRRFEGLHPRVLPCSATEFEGEGTGGCGRHGEGRSHDDQSGRQHVYVRRCLQAWNSGGGLRGVP